MPCDQSINQRTALNCHITPMHATHLRNMIQCTFPYLDHPFLCIQDPGSSGASRLVSPALRILLVSRSGHNVAENKINTMLWLCPPAKLEYSDWSPRQPSDNPSALLLSQQLYGSAAMRVSNSQQFSKHRQACSLRLPDSASHLPEASATGLRKLILCCWLIPTPSGILRLIH